MDTLSHPQLNIKDAAKVAMSAEKQDVGKVFEFAPSLVNFDDTKKLTELTRLSCYHET
jgi:hypothetical protein